MTEKTTISIRIDKELKEKAKKLSAKVRLSISEIIKLCLDGLSEKEILELYEKK